MARYRFFLPRRFAGIVFWAQMVIFSSFLSLWEPAMPAIFFTTERSNNRWQGQLPHGWLSRAPTF
jgi:hypothetical protein